MSIEESIKQTIRQFEKETLERLAAASEEGKQRIREWVNTYLKSLQVELPMSIKAVLDAGGEVHQLRMKKEEGWGPEVILRSHKEDKQIQLSALRQATEVRVTIIAEPVQ